MDTMKETEIDLCVQYRNIIEACKFSSITLKNVYSCEVYLYLCVFVCVFCRYILMSSSEQGARRVLQI